MYLEFGDDAVEGGTEGDGIGVGDIHRLGVSKDLTGRVVAKGGRGGTGERDGGFAVVEAVTENHHRVTAHREGEVEFTESGVGGGVGTHLCHFALFIAV